jgi:hypothetical protein
MGGEIMGVIRSFAVATACVLLSGTAGWSQDKPYTTDAPEQVVAAGSIGGSWFIITTAMYDLFQRNIEGLRYTITPGGAIANPMAVEAGMATAALGYTSMLHAAHRGQEPFKSTMEDFRGILNLNVAGVLHPIVLESSGITSLDDLAAREIGVSIDTGPRGTGGELAASRLLELYGAGYANIRDWGGSITHSSYREALGRMKDGHIEAFLNDDVVGNPVFVDIAHARDVRILSMSPDVVEQMVSLYGYAPAVIPANSYEGQTEDVVSTAQSFVFFTHKDASEELVYLMTKLTFENKPDLVAAHAIFKALDVEKGPGGFPIPLHPGAERYYREIGILE